MAASGFLHLKQKCAAQDANGVPMVCQWCECALCATVISQIAHLLHLRLHPHCNNRIKLPVFSKGNYVFGIEWMTPEDFKSWRKAMGLKQKETAALLGLKKRMIQYYEKGRRGNKKVDIPKTVELACYALSRGVSAFDGKTAKNSFAGLGAAEDIEMVKSKNKSSK